MLAHNVVEPTVIDEDLLTRCASDQATGDAADIARKEGIDLKEVTSLRLDYKNILRIEHLWQLTNLTKLQLDNNIIEKISGLDHLVNLRWLDLSFNNISVIEGLDKCTSITDLSLFNNRISKIEGLDALTKLNVLSIGNNDLHDMHQLAYLARFDHLRLLNIAGNPLCAEHPDYRAFILSRLKNLKYLDYRLVDAKAVTAAREKYIDDIIAIEEEQKIVTKAALEVQLKKEENTMYAAAFLPGIVDLFQVMFDTDADYQRLLPLTREVLMDIQNQYREKFSAVVKELTGTVLEHHDKRAEEVRQFAACLEQALEASDAISRKSLNAFMHDKKIMLKDISGGATTATGSGIGGQLPDVYRAKLTGLSDELLHLELTLVEQFEEVGKEFERNYLDMCGVVKELVAASFTKMRELENEHHEKVTETVMAAFDRQSKAVDVEDLDDAVRDLLRDKDAVTNHITGSHDMHLSKIDGQEEAFNSGLAKHMDMVINQVHQYEVDRNRARLKEIVIFSERCLQELDSRRRMRH
ncbi:hypothetical protein BCR44DRAFT_131583, partial [Catenaria anguillulae PL171]